MAYALMLESGVRGETRRRRIQSLLRGPGLRQAVNDSTPIPCGPLSFNAEFMPPALEEGSALVPWIGGKLDDFLCETFERVVGKDNCGAFEGMALQIPKDRQRMHYMKVKVWVHCQPDGDLAVFHGPRCLARYDAQGQSIPLQLQVVAQVRCSIQSGQFMYY